MSFKLFNNTFGEKIMSKEKSKTGIAKFTVEHLFDEVKLKPFHKKIWFLSAMGIFLEGYNLFVIGIALPLIKDQDAPGTLMLGLIGAAAIAGTILGSFTLGRLADIIGRKKFYIIDMVLIMFFALMSGIFGYHNLYLLVFFQFMIGIGIGADYPICASYISEFMPSRIRGRMIISAFSFQALGMIVSALVGLCMIKLINADSAWRWMLLFGALPSGIILFFRIFVDRKSVV